MKHKSINLKKNRFKVGKMYSTAAKNGKNEFLHKYRKYQCVKIPTYTQPKVRELKFTIN